MEQNTMLKIKEAIERNSAVMEELAELYKVFSDSSRVKILCALTQSDMCVSEISAFLNITQSAISHQLKTLKASSLVKTKRVGKNIVYSLANENVRAIIDCGMEYLLELN